MAEIQQFDVTLALKSDQIRDFLGAVEGRSASDDSLDVEIDFDVDGGQLIIVDSEGQPLVVLVLHGELTNEEKRNEWLLEKGDAPRLTLT